METPKPGQVVHVEVVSKDPKATQKFYKTVFGLEYKPAPAGDMPYWMVEDPNPPGAGLRSPMGPEAPGSIPYYLVTSVDDAVKKIEKAGGKILSRKQEVPQMGWFALAKVPGDVVVGVWETNPDAPMPG